MTETFLHGFVSPQTFTLECTVDILVHERTWLRRLILDDALPRGNAAGGRPRSIGGIAARRGNETDFHWEVEPARAIGPRRG